MEKKAILQFIGYKVISSEFKVGDHPVKEVVIKVDTSVVSDDHIMMDVNISNSKDDNFLIKVKMIGEFQFKEDISDAQKKTFKEINAPAILFPYLRAYISALTALSGINPITLPTINFSGRSE